MTVESERRSGFLPFWGKDVLLRWIKKMKDEKKDIIVRVKKKYKKSYSQKMKKKCCL